ncbi:unnamed protein product [Polarella glacialis]|uniref:Uncharacterized protein n=1 Tax=Polarella glacialis TaxID=89957 RepID=A0A813ELW9_POLGL|nr:unnamed protein product [Polarella glacialis]
MSWHGSATPWLMDWDSRASSFRGHLRADHGIKVQVAQVCFLCSMYLPMLLYYLGASEYPTKFPASLSYTSSKAPSKYVCLLFWALGWCIFLHVLWASDDLVTQLFAAQMVLTGVLAAWFNKPGQCRAANLIHMAAAIAYILDHIVFMHVLDMTATYRQVFYTSCVLTAAALQCTNAIKVSAAGLSVKYASSPAEWQKMLSQVGPTKAGQLWWSELTFMVFENLILTAFILGMSSGIG